MKKRILSAGDRLENMGAKQKLDALLVERVQNAIRAAGYEKGRKGMNWTTLAEKTGYKDASISRFMSDGSGSYTLIRKLEIALKQRFLGGDDAIADLAVTDTPIPASVELELGRPNFNEACRQAFPPPSERVRLLALRVGERFRLRADPPLGWWGTLLATCRQLCDLQDAAQEFAVQLEQEVAAAQGQDTGTGGGGAGTGGGKRLCRV